MKSHTLRNFLIITVLFLPLMMSAQISIQKAGQGSKKPEKNGFAYALPRTLLNVNLTIKETEFIKGPYAEYASELLGITNPVGQSYKEYEFIDASFNVLAEPDPDQYYFIEVEERSKDERNIMISVTENGIIKSVNSSASSKDYSRSILEEYKAGAAANTFGLGMSPALQRRVDTIIRIVTVDTTTVRKRFFNIRFEEKPTEQRAREAAEMVAKIRDSRFNLLTGYQETNFSKETMEYMDIQLRKLLDEYVSLFRGLKLERTLNYSFVITPDESKPNITVCRFSKEGGVLDASDAKGRELVLSLKRQGHTNALPSWIDNPAESRNPVIYYRIPESVQTGLRFGGKTYDEEMIQISQFGRVGNMPVVKSRIEFYPMTGAVKSVFFE
ncbi:MAG: DUF4831 family protein [Bacteroidales bacterium]|nr:DUF4831 family protein [Bacteroidales bacterium]